MVTVIARVALGALALMLLALGVVGLGVWWRLHDADGNDLLRRIWGLRGILAFLAGTAFAVGAATVPTATGTWVGAMGCLLLIGRELAIRVIARRSQGQNVTKG